MARILADKDVRRLLGSVLINADEERLNPNGIELRFGGAVLFHSTGEEKMVNPGMFVKISPGETVIISSIESVDFSPTTAQSIFPQSMLMGLITPTTTMMREGISQVATKIDAGYCGVLNWGLRNGSTRDLILGYGEPIFKLTIFVLDQDESPDLPYGERPADSYQGAEGIKRSTRRIPADIPKSKIVASSFGQLDPKKQLREAGYPFGHIATELATLDGKIEVVSTDVRLMKDEFQRQVTELARKIGDETSTLSKKIEESRTSLLEKVESLFDRKFSRVAGIGVGAIPVMYGGVVFFQGTGFKGNTVAFIAIVAGLAIILLTYVLGRRS